MVGRRIGRFEVLSALGKGGMGSVWKAEDSLLGRAVAIKILSDELAQDDESRRRFRREGEIAAQLDHPGICTVYEAGEHDGLAWIAMACIDGVTLSEKLRARLMPVAEVLRVGRMTADALAHAHARDVLHRDVTSRNVMLARDGRVILLDFGLAIVSDASRITGPGAVVGTIAYMAPELLAGGNATPQSDLYGLGVVLYEALTGARPFHSENAEALRYRVLQESPEPVRALRPEVPAALEAVVMKAMARQAEDRFESAEEMLEALKGCEGDAGAEPEPEAPAHRVSITLSSWTRRPARVDSSADTALAGDGGANGAARDIGARIAAGAQPVFLGVLPMEDAGGDGHAERARVLAEAVNALASSLSSLDRVRVVDLPAGGALRERARLAGANLVLQSRARADGSMLRITFSLLDPETGARHGGGTVDGSVLEPFRLEDAFIDAVGAALSRSNAPARRRRRASDPAARDRYAQALSYLERFDNEASLDGAVALLEALLDSEGESGPVWAALARAHLARHALTRQRPHLARATAACDRARACDPFATETLLACADLHLASGRAEEALRDVDEAARRNADPCDAGLLRALALAALHRNEDAERACRDAIAQRPHDWRAHHHLGMMKFRRGAYGEAIEAWREVVRLCPDNAGAHRNIAVACNHLDRFDEAIEGFRRSLAIRPSAMGYYNLATALFYMDRHEEALAAYEQAVALNPSDPVAWGNLGNACRFIPGREARMREALGRAIAVARDRLDRDPSEAEIWARLAGWYANLGRMDEAMAAIREAIGRGADDVHCMINAAQVYLRAGDRETAVQWLRRAALAGYGAESITRNPDLVSLKDDPRIREIVVVRAKE